MRASYGGVRRATLVGPPTFRAAARGILASVVQQMLDSEDPPSGAQIRSMWAAGVRVYGGYLGGRAGRVWTPDEFHRVSTVDGTQPAGSIGLLGYWETTPQDVWSTQLGWQHGNAARAAVVQIGAAPYVAPSFPLIVALAVEGNQTAVALGSYADAFAAALGPLPSAGYSNPGTHSAGIFRAFDGAIVAAYPTGDATPTPPAINPYDPRTGVSPLYKPGRRAWQAQGTHTEWGLGVDRGVADDWFRSPAGGTSVFDSQVVDTVLTPSGAGAYILTATGAVYTTGDAHYRGGINPGNPDRITRVGDVKRIHLNPAGYTIETQDANNGMVRFYAFPLAGAPGVPDTTG